MKQGMLVERDTIAACATAPGEAALAMIRCSGPLCGAIAQAYMGGKVPVARRVSLVQIYSVEGVLIDQALLVFFPKPASHTGEDVLEITLHGNPFLTERLLRDLMARGCRHAEPGEFTRRAFLAGKMDLSQAEAVADLVRARSDAAVRSAQRQMAGELAVRVDAMTRALISLIAEVEAYLDFPEEDLPEENLRAQRTQIEDLVRQARSLAATRRYGAFVRDGVRVVLAGLPNAGKSSLLNKLAQRERALVHEDPGTTRDFLEEAILVGPYRVILVDTAGLRAPEAASVVERAGIERTLEQLRSCDLAWWVIDTTETILVETQLRSVMDPLKGTPIWLINNKIDLQRDETQLQCQDDRPIFRLSAKTGVGIPGLLQALESWIRAAQGPDSESLAVSARHAHALEAMAEHLETALGRMQFGPTDMLAASDLRAAKSELDQVVGRIDNERILDELFARFCIGK